MPAALVLVTVAIAYCVYMALSGLARRIRLDRVRMLGLFAHAQARWGSINILLYWAFFAMLAFQLATGGMLYFGLVSNMVSTLHWFGTWAILGYSALHVLAHAASGGKAQLLRIFRPAPLTPPSPPLDPVELLVLLAERADPQAASRVTAESMSSSPQASREEPADPDPPRQTVRVPADAGPGMRVPFSERGSGRGPRGYARRRGPVLQANPFMVASAVAIVGTLFLVTIDRHSVDTLHVRRIAAAEAPVLDGDTSDPVWRTATPLYVVTGQGGNFDGTGETTVEIRAVHDGSQAYFLFAWDDPTRSLKQLPLIKKTDGWHLLHDGYERADERAYSEDKFSVLLTASNVTLAGDRTFHAGPQPIDGKPRTLSGRGLHYTTGGQVYADVWEWKATSTGPFGWMDDDHFGPPVEPTDAQSRGMTPYHGGFTPDPGTANYADNFAPRLPDGYAQPLTPRRLPKDFRAMLAAMGPIDLDPDHGESGDARWYMSETESVPYSAELDARIPVGVVIPGVIVSGTFSGDRADVHCAARWAAGRWAIEVSRRLDTGSKYDIPIRTGTYMRVAAFDHNQIRHTRHVRPIRLEVE